MNVDIGAAFSSLLLSQTAITSRVQTRVYSDRLIQNAKSPAIVYWVVTETAHEGIDQATGLDQARFQVDSYGLTRPQASEVAWHIWNEVAGYSGTISDVYILGLSRITGVRHTTDRVEAGTLESPRAVVGSIAAVHIPADNKTARATLFIANLLETFLYIRI